MLEVDQYAEKVATERFGLPPCGLSEKWSVEYHGSAEMRAKNLASPAKIQYADLADIVKMLNRKTGGLLQDPVNDAQSLIREAV
jgi:hypothetical protein